MKRNEMTVNDSDRLKVDGKLFQKTRLFGNQKQQIVFKNRMSYKRSKSWGDDD